MSINAEWVVNNSGERIYAISHAKAIVSGSTTLDKRMTSLESKDNTNTSSLSTTKTNANKISTSPATTLRNGISTATTNANASKTKSSTLVTDVNSNKSTISTNAATISTLQSNSITSLAMSSNTLQGKNASGTVISSVDLSSVTSYANAHSLSLDTLWSGSKSIRDGSTDITTTKNLSDYGVIGFQVNYADANTWRFNTWFPYRHMGSTEKWKIFIAIYGNVDAGVAAVEVHRKADNNTITFATWGNTEVTWYIKKIYGISVA